MFYGGKIIKSKLFNKETFNKSTSDSCCRLFMTQNLHICFSFETKCIILNCIKIILKAVSHENNIVAYEITLNLQRLVSKYGKDLQFVTWEIILDILEALLNQIEVGEIT